jgi:hypothetical protein
MTSPTIAFSAGATSVVPVLSVARFAVACASQ